MNEIQRKVINDKILLLQETISAQDISIGNYRSDIDRKNQALGEVQRDQDKTKRELEQLMQGALHV